MIETSAVEVFIGFAVIALAALGHYHYRKLCFKVEPFILRSAWRQTKIMCALEHIALGLFVIPFVDIFQRLVRLILDRSADHAPVLILSWGITIIPLAFIYTMTIKAAVTVDQLHYERASKRPIGWASWFNDVEDAIVHGTVMFMQGCMLVVLLAFHTPYVINKFLTALGSLSGY